MNLKPSTFSQAYKSVVQVLKTDPVLRREVSSWQTYDGSPVSPASSGNAPRVEVRPKFGQGDWATNGTAKQILTLVVTCTGPPDSDASKGLDFWAVVYQALYPGDPNRKAEVDRIISPAIRHATVVRPSFSIDPEGRFVSHGVEIDLQIFSPRS